MTLSLINVELQVFPNTPLTSNTIGALYVYNMVSFNGSMIGSYTILECDLGLPQDDKGKSPLICCILTLSELDVRVELFSI